MRTPSWGSWPFTSPRIWIKVWWDPEKLGEELIRYFLSFRRNSCQVEQAAFQIKHSTRQVHLSLVWTTLWYINSVPVRFLQWKGVLFSIMDNLQWYPNFSLRLILLFHLFRGIRNCDYRTHFTLSRNIYRMDVFECNRWLDVTNTICMDVTEVATLTGWSWRRSSDREKFLSIVATFSVSLF
jgi:hypothetical protein